MEESFNLHLYNTFSLEAAGEKKELNVCISMQPGQLHLLSPAERRNLALFLLKQPLLSLGSLISNEGPSL